MGKVGVETKTILYQALNVFISAVELDILQSGSMRIDSFVETALRTSNF